MSAHSSHLLQPLDVSCFRPLKQLYGWRIRDAIQNGNTTIDKADFLFHFQHIYNQIFSKANILSGFRATGLIPLEPEKVLLKLQIKFKMPTPPSSLHSSSHSFYLGKTPANLYQLNQQKKQLQDLENQGLSTLVAGEMIGKIIKGAEIAMQNAILLQNEVHQLRTADERQKNKKKASRYFIQDGGSLTGQEGYEKGQEKESELLAQQSTSKSRRPPCCSNCNKEGHNRLKCPDRLIS